METVPQRYDGPDFQRPVGFEPQDRWGRYRLLPVAAAESSIGGRGESSGAASSDQAELAKKLQNPVADLISVPLQNNWDFGIGPADAMKYTVFQNKGGDSCSSHAPYARRSLQS
jgi:hypothetical protein